MMKDGFAVMCIKDLANAAAQKPESPRAVSFMRRILLVIGLIVGLGFNLCAHAETFVWVADAFQIKYIARSDGKTYIRNLGDFSSYALGAVITTGLMPRQMAYALTLP